MPNPTSEHDPRLTSETPSGWSDAEAHPAADNDEAAAPRGGGFRSVMRGVAVGLAAVLLVIGVVSLITALNRHAGKALETDVAALRKTIAEEEEALARLREDYDETEQTRSDKQEEYDEARAKLDAGVVDYTVTGTGMASQDSLSALQARASAAQQTYSDVLDEYNAAVDAVEESAADYDTAKATLVQTQSLLGYAAAYEQFAAGATNALPAMDAGENGEAPDAQAWYAQIVLPAAAQAGVTLPASVAEFPAAIRAQTASAAQTVQTYETALAASTDAEARLEAANEALEQAQRDYAAAVQSQKSGEQWLSECEAELERLQNRLDTLESSIEKAEKTLETHRAELEALESKQ